MIRARIIVIFLHDIYTINILFIVCDSNTFEKIICYDEPRWLNAVFNKQVKKSKKDVISIGGGNFKWKCMLKKINDDGENIMKLRFRKKEWIKDHWSTVTLTYANDDDDDRKCLIQLIHVNIPKYDSQDTPGELEYMKNFWKKHILKGLSNYCNLKSNIDP